MAEDVSLPAEPDVALVFSTLFGADLDPELIWDTEELEEIAALRRIVLETTEAAPALYSTS